ncbi:hypothetical protein ACO0LM_11840 [Undibacterium sp. Di26W]|uniref:phage tail tube protein n=1 Tax=Undibacterium sp. Di26W TaxID=3413035 RepID=UPI003BF0A0ED
MSTGFLGAGDVFIEKFDPATAAWLPAVGPYETSKLEIKMNSDLKEQTSKRKATYGQTTTSVALPKPADFSIEFAQVDAETLQMALMAEATTINQASGTVADEVVVAKVGAWVKLAHDNVAGTGVVVKNSAGTTTYDKDVDYEINYRLGMLRALKDSDIADLASLKVSYGYNAVTGTLLSGAKVNQIKIRITMDGVNFADNLPAVLKVHQAVLSPDTAFDFLSNDFGKVGLKGRMETPAGKSEPFTVAMHDTV